MQPLQSPHPDFMSAVQAMLAGTGDYDQLKTADGRPVTDVVINEGSYAPIEGILNGGGHGYDRLLCWRSDGLYNAGSYKFAYLNLILSSSTDNPIPTVDVYA